MVQNMCKIFSLVPSKKPVTKENWEKISVYFSIFWMIKFTVIPKKVIWHLAIWQNWCFGQFYHSKLKSKHLLCLSFLWWKVFSREQEKIFYIYSGPRIAHWNPVLWGKFWIHSSQGPIFLLTSAFYFPQGQLFYNLILTYSIKVSSFHMIKRGWNLCT